MKIKPGRDRLAQSTIAYVIFIIVLLAAFSAVAVKLRQKTQAAYKESADVFGEGRQLGSALNPSGGVAPFVFPVLPGKEPVVVVPPIVIPNPNCDFNLLVSLQDCLQIRLKNAKDLTDELATASKLEADAILVYAKAQEAAVSARSEATAARTAATAARTAADTAYSRYRTARSAYNACVAGNAGCVVPNCVDCSSALNLMNSRWSTYLTRNAEATTLEGIATDKESIATEKEALLPPLLAEVDRLTAITATKQTAAEKAQTEADEAAKILQEANQACYG